MSVWILAAPGAARAHGFNLRTEGPFMSINAQAVAFAGRELWRFGGALRVGFGKFFPGEDEWRWAFPPHVSAGVFVEPTVTHDTPPRVDAGIYVRAGWNALYAEVALGVGTSDARGTPRFVIGAGAPYGIEVFTGIARMDGRPSFLMGATIGWPVPL